MATISSVISPVVQLLSDVIEVINNNDDNPQTLQIDLRAVEILVQDLAALFRGQQQAPPEIVMFWLQLLQNSLSQVKRLLNRRLGRGQRFVDCVVCKPRRFYKEVTYWNSFFNHLYHGFQGELPMLLTSLHFLSTKPVYKEDATGSGRIRDAQRLCEDDGWMLFRRVAFKEEHVSMDIEDRGRLIAAECKGMPLAINMVAAAMIEQRSVDEWDNCLSSIRSVADTSTFAATHPDHLDAQLYKFFQWSYDALPNSNLKNCFLYSAMYQQDLENGNPIVPYGSGRVEGVDSRELVEMWIGEGLVKSQEGTHIMDMAIGRNYIKLLVQRCFFHIVNQSTNVCRGSWYSRIHDVFPSIRVPEGIREMAMDIAQKEGKFLVMRSPDLRNLQEDQYENCRRISFVDNPIGDLPTNFRCPNLASFILAGKTGLKELPSGFLLFLTSLTVLNLSGCEQITSIPTSVGQLTQLEFLSLSGLRIRDLPPEISHLSKLQFLNLSRCASLESLPSQIGELKNLKHLNLWRCDSLKMIPREISQLTSLCRLQIWTDLSVEMEAPATIWSLKALKNLTELAVFIKGKSGIKDGIMGTWSEMRHLNLNYCYNASKEDLPQDVQNMRKLQSFMLYWYRGLNLPNCKFAHLEMVGLYYCSNIRELTPLERLPNLKILKLCNSCSELRELGIGSGGSVGYPRLQKLVLRGLEKLESLCGASNRGVWDEGTLPHLRVLKIHHCPSLKRFPSGMEKLQNLSALVCSKDQWESMMWEDDNMRVKLQNILKHRY